MKFVKAKPGILFLFILFMSVSQSLVAQSSHFSKNQYVNDKGDTLLYRLLYPDSDTLRKYPLIIFFARIGRAWER